MKKDALWKPLLRNFRIYLRKSLQEYLVQMSSIWDTNGDLLPSAQNACRLFIRSVGASARAQEDKFNHFGLIVTMVPSSSGNLEKFFASAPEVLSQIHRLRPLFSKIFRENSIQLRQDFFQNEMLRAIWSRYVRDEKEEIKSYLNKLRRTIPYQRQVEILLNDALVLSETQNFQILLPEHFC